MPKSHNKKRNVGIIYELLLRRVSEQLVSENTRDAQVALNIISKRFKKGTELYREFKLFKALSKSNASNQTVASSILSESKRVAQETSLKKLDKEKSDLIREINYTFKDPKFYKSYLPDYKALATIQTLLNDWRDTGNYNIARIAEYESKVLSHILEDKSERSLDDEKNPDVDSLVVKIMSEKINKKYKGVFNRDQKKILNMYAISSNSKDLKKIDEMEKLLESIKLRSITSLDKLVETTENKTIFSKIDEVKDSINSQPCKDLDDQKISRFLTMIDLCNEIREMA